MTDLYEFCNCLHTRRNHTSNGIGHCMFYDGMPCPCSEFTFPNFPRPSQNQTVSGGVEGAHEGTTADKSEPEKLNNAQKAHFVSQFPESVHKYDDRCDQCNVGLDGWIPCDKCDIAVCSHKCLDAHKCPSEALAESSLSQKC